jgi:transcriptional regulator with PAS, ATPase and Fis domain
MVKVLDAIETVAPTEATVLVRGESGTGKELVATAIHQLSSRAKHPLVKVNCAAIPETLLESELFGHEKGAFTDAKERRRGVFESADRGAVFLDEIGDMPLSLQAKLLGIIEDRSFSRIGGTQRVEVDVRIIAATHRDLETAVEEGRFREDLLYRLRVVPIIIPALRDRPDDIIPLANRFLEVFQREFGTGPKELGKAAQEYLRSHAWPGNVRELRNVIERAMLFSSGEELEPADLLIELGYKPRTGGRGGSGGNFTLPADGVHLEKVEQDLVRQAMQRSGNNQSRAAALLGISRDQIRYRLEKMGLIGGKKKS